MRFKVTEVRSTSNVVFVVEDSQEGRVAHYVHSHASPSNYARTALSRRWAEEHCADLNCSHELAIRGKA